MRKMVSAEWTKLLPHRGTWLLVWLYPIAVGLIMAIAIGVKLASSEPGAALTAKAWIDQTAPVWYVPTISLGRYLVAAYFALVFAGEYGWNTWKLVVPHAARWKLIGAKYLVTIGLLYLAWIAAALIAVLLQFAKSTVAGEAIPQGVTLAAILAAHGKLILLGIAPLLITAAYASVMAVLTRSTLAAFLISLVFVTFDELLGKIVGGLSNFGMEWLALPYRVLPSYHLENWASWLRGGTGYQLNLASGTVVAYSHTTSLLVLAVWILGLATLCLFAFRRQDIN
jgi:ABC-2 type transport system permease protein